MNKAVKIIICLLILYLIIGVSAYLMLVNATKSMVFESSEDLLVILVWPIFIGSYLKCGSFICFIGNLWPFL